MSSAVIDKAQGKWTEILSSLGVPDEALSRKNCPCPMCGGKDRFRFTDHQCLGWWHCNQCGSGDGIELLKQYHGWDFKEAAREVESIVGEVKPTFRPSGPDPSIRLNHIRKGILDPAEVWDVPAYLRSRGLEVPTSLKAHPGVAYYDGGEYIGDYSAMVGLVQKGSKPLTYHLTYLQDGKKAPLEPARKILKPVENINGGAIRLYPQAAHMGVAEGIETAIAAKMLSGLPVWSVLSTQGMESWYPPEGVDTVTIFGDNDAKYGGQKAAYALAHKLAMKGFTVNVRIPPDAGMDWNDVLFHIERKREADDAE